jgi:hypothetical protein
LQLISPSTSPNELNTTLTPHSMIHGDACFAYFNKIWDIPRDLSGTRWIGRAISSKFSEFSSNSFIMSIGSGSIQVMWPLTPISRRFIEIAWDVQ